MRGRYRFGGSDLVVGGVDGLDPRDRLARRGGRLRSVSKNFWARETFEKNLKVDDCALRNW